jgi:broad specificity phosphatase PhoE
MKEKIVYLIRHGESQNNTLTDRKLRLVDPLLTENGRQQVLSAAKRMSSCAFNITNAIGLVSPFARAIETASILKNCLGIDFEILKELHEVGGYFDTDKEKSDITFSVKSPTYKELIETYDKGLRLGNCYNEGDCWWDTKSIDNTPYRIDFLINYFSNLGDAIIAVTHGDLIKCFYGAENVVVSNSSIHKLTIGSGRFTINPCLE